jgi:hypothetical protein
MRSTTATTRDFSRESDDRKVDSKPQHHHIVKRCACGAAYTADAWARLSFCGDMCIGDAMAELRNCVCGSSLALRESDRH